MQRIPAYLLEGVGFFNCMLDTYLDTYLSIPQQHAVNTHLLDHEKVPSSQGAINDTVVEPACLLEWEHQEKYGSLTDRVGNDPVHVGSVCRVSDETPILSMGEKHPVVHMRAIIDNA